MENNLERIAELRAENYSYQFIADKLGMPMNTVKSLCRRHGFQANGPRKTKAEKLSACLCKYCQKPLESSRRKDTAFCSDYCRVAWRRKNLKIHEQKA